MVCDADPHCCCFGWDADCRTLANDLCGVSCPTIDIGVGGVQIPDP